MIKKNENTGSAFKKIRWISFVSNRFASVDRKGRSAVTSFLATLGICIGVMTLIVVISVMNGFQMSFIDSILEISSYHGRVTDLPEEMENDFVKFCTDNKNIESVSVFYEAQSLMTGKKNETNSVIVRGVSDNILNEDKGFKRELQIVQGDFDLSSKNSIVLGYYLANSLGVSVGDTVNLLIMSGGRDVALFSDDRSFVVTGIFSCGYQEINNGYAFVNLDAAREYFGKKSKRNWGLKFAKYDADVKIISQIKKNFPQSSVDSWRNYNKSFFGALKIEKNMLFLLVALIFVVVAINIYNGMRRIVFERKSEIAILSALGAKKWEIKLVFILKGMFMGFIGAVCGMNLGIIIADNSDVVFTIISKIMFCLQYAVTFITEPENLMYVQENSTYSVYASIPARIFPKEVVMITLFGIVSPLFASWAASKNVLKLTVSEVLHYE